MYRADALTVALDGQPILHDLTFEIPPGQWVALLGPNGSGKTTLLRTLGGLLPHTGTLALEGQPVESFSARERARIVAFVRQSLTLDFDLTVDEIVGLGLMPHVGWLARPSADQHDRLAEALTAMDLHALCHRAVASLSGGEQQRVFLAQALVQDTPLLLLDEPTAHLDVHHQHDLMQRVAALAEGGKTVVSAIHDLDLAARFADRLLVLDGGRIAADGPPAETLTPALIRRVFRMEAEVEATPDGLRVRYLAPV